MIDRISGAGRAYIRLCFLLMLLGAASCASSGNGVAPVCPEPEASSQDYVIGAGDVLEVFVWREPDLSGTIPVRPDGKISISLVEDMTAVGKTPTELARDMEQVLAEYLRLPKVNIIVVTEGSSNQIQVIGSVVSPQSIPYRDDIRVLDVVVVVGGLDDFAAGNRSQVVRTINGATTECEIRLNDLMRDGDMSQNIFMYPGDVLIVPQSRF